MRVFSRHIVLEGMTLGAASNTIAHLEQVGSLACPADVVARVERFQAPHVQNHTCGATNLERMRLMSGGCDGNMTVVERVCLGVVEPGTGNGGVVRDVWLSV